MAAVGEFAEGATMATWGSVLGVGGCEKPADQSQATRGQSGRQGGAGAGVFGGVCAEWRSSGGMVVGESTRDESRDQDLAAVLWVSCLRLCPSQIGAGTSADGRSLQGFEETEGND